MTDWLNTTSFLLSRVYAEGWNAARGPEGAKRANPYSAEPQRGRWQAGFVNAQKAPTRESL